MIAHYKGAIFFQFAHLITFLPPHAFHPTCQEWEAEVTFLRPRCCSVLCQCPTYGGFSFKGLTLKLKAQNLLTWIKKEIGDKTKITCTSLLDLHIGLTTATAWQGYLENLICWALFVRCTTENNAAAWACQRNERAKPGHFQRFSHLPRLFFICSPITLYVCVFVRPSVMLVEIRVVSTCLALVCQSVCLRACLYAVQNSINAGQIFTWFDAG